MTYKTSEEVRSEYISLLGEDLGFVWFNFKQDFHILQLEWRIYNSFFSSGPERIDLLCRASARTAQIIEKIMFRSALLSLRRLVKAGQGGKSKEPETISIHRVVALVGEGSTKSELTRFAKLASDESELAFTWVDKTIAHVDIPVRAGASSISPVTKSHVDAAMEAISRFINCFGQKLLGTSYVFDIIAPYGNDELALLQVIYDGLSVKQEREDLRDRLRAERDWKALQALPNYPDWLMNRPRTDWGKD